ncbi:MAG: peptidylprolyl isomerase, partial [Verrucomicrobia bacterium]
MPLYMMSFPERSSFVFALALAFTVTAVAAPVIDPIPNINVPAGKSILLPITATSPNGRRLTYTATSSTNRITVEIHTNNPFWRMSVAQVAPTNAPGTYLTPFRGTFATVTNLGDMTFMLLHDLAPKTVDVFQGLTMAGYFSTNTIFHRVIPGFVIQAGDPATNGAGGPVFRYEDELQPRALFSGNGQLAMAHPGVPASKDNNGSQFFVTFGSQRFLDLGYTLFGQQLRGFDVATNIVNTPRNANDRPYADVIITRVGIVTNLTDTVIT